MRAGAIGALVVVLLAIAAGAYVLIATASGQAFNIGGEIIAKNAVIPITIVIAVICGIWFFRSRGRGR